MGAAASLAGAQNSVRAMPAGSGIAGAAAAATPAAASPSTVTAMM
jgi:hypothetical protein